MKVRPLLNTVLASHWPLSEEQVCRCLLVSQPSLSSEELRRRCQVLRRVLCLARDETLRPFHHSFAEWMCDVKHCTQRFLCSPANGHAMLAMQLTLKLVLFLWDLSVEVCKGWKGQLIRINSWQQFKMGHLHVAKVLEKNLSGIICP